MERFYSKEDGFIRGKRQSMDDPELEFKTQFMGLGMINTMGSKQAYMVLLLSIIANNLKNT